MPLSQFLIAIDSLMVVIILIVILVFINDVARELVESCRVIRKAKALNLRGKDTNSPPYYLFDACIFKCIEITSTSSMGNK